eukprot:scaffold90653_cov22-Tisochrysis_lutea.AAC.1
MKLGQHARPCSSAHPKGDNDPARVACSMRERMKRMRAAKLARALDQDRELSSRASEAGSLRSSIASSALGREAAARGRYHPMLMLRPEEEALVEAVLQRPPTDLAESGNPFQLSGQEADPEAAAALTPAG